MKRLQTFVGFNDTKSNMNILKQYYSIQNNVHMLSFIAKIIRQIFYRINYKDLNLEL